MKILTDDIIISNVSNSLPNVKVKSVFRKEIGKKQIMCVCVCLIDGNEWSAYYGNLLRGRGCPKCGGNYRPSIEEVKASLSKINKNIKILDDVYVNSFSKLNCVCLIDGHTWNPTYADLSQGKGCPKCKIKKISELRMKTRGNSIQEIRPDLMIYLKNKEDGLKYGHCSTRKISLICPKCGQERNDMVVYYLSSNGFNCKYCSDGISIPEKFVANILNQLGITFETQKRFTQTENKRYDFYIPSLELIIETHGGQHYKHSTRGRLLREEQDNDLYKRDLAIKSGVKPDNYIVIDCRISKLGWLKDNCINSLGLIFDLSNVDFVKVWEESQNSFINKIWDLWNNKKECETTTTISRILNIDKCTVIKYLKIGNEIGKCVYIPKVGKNKKHYNY